MNILLQLELVFQGNLSDQFFHCDKRHNFIKIEKTAGTSPTFFRFKIRIPPNSMYRENCGGFH